MIDSSKQASKASKQATSRSTCMGFVEGEGEGVVAAFGGFSFVSFLSLLLSFGFLVASCVFSYFFLFFFFSFFLSFFLSSISPVLPVILLYLSFLSLPVPSSPPFPFSPSSPTNQPLPRTQRKTSLHGSKSLRFPSLP